MSEAVPPAAFVALAPIRSVVSHGMPVVWEILRIATNLVCAVLLGISAHGNIDPWGAWVGVDGVFAVLLIALYVSRPAKKTARGSSPNPWMKAE